MIKTLANLHVYGDTDQFDSTQGIFADIPGIEKTMEIRKESIYEGWLEVDLIDVESNGRFSVGYRDPYGIYYVFGLNPEKVKHIEWKELN